MIKKKKSQPDDVYMCIYNAFLKDDFIPIKLYTKSCSVATFFVVVKKTVETLKAAVAATAASAFPQGEVFLPNLFFLNLILHCSGTL